MRLKALELQGFKSFPDKTTLNFDSGVTVVVGPNGSGKSNISDAVRWVLGEISSKNIRGTKMEDIIFGGSDNRRPMGYAEVSLVIDNTGGTGRLSMDYDEITVTRRYFRNGDSEYMINRRPVRLRDITELFMNTGVGRTGYSIIGQGKISEIISQKSDERRNVFEEAAGISKYRFKKQEAERKLKEVDENSVRLSDIINELSSRIGPLEKESAKAKQYLELYEQKKEADVSLWLYDVAAVKDKLAEAERRYTAAKLELEDADSVIAAYEAKSDKLYLSVQENNLISEQTDREIRELLSKRSTLESAGKVLENDIYHIKEQIIKLEGEQKLALSDIDVSRGKLEEYKRGLESEKEALASLRGELAENDIKTGDTRTLLEEKDREIDSAEAEIRALEQDLTDLKIRLSALEGSYQTSSGRGEDIDSEIEKTEESMKLLDERSGRAERAVKEYDDKLSSIKKESGEISRSVKELEEKKEELRAECDKIRLDIASKKQRADSLRRMEELFEGYSQSVKRIMNASESGDIRGICGPVSHLIKVSSKHGMAVETALGANIQNIVVEDEESAKSAIEYLKRNNAGRATFYPVTSVKGQTINVPRNELAAKTGYIGIADELVECDLRYKNIISSMLGRTAVFDNIDNAASAARAFGFRVRIVTSDGQMINAGGSFTGGSARRESGMLTRNSEISKLDGETEKLKKELLKKESEISEISKRLDELQSELSDSDAKISLISSLAQAEQTQLEVLRAQYSGDESRRNALLEDRRQLGEQRQHYNEEHDRLASEINGTEEKYNEKHEHTERLLEEKNDLQYEFEALIAGHNEIMLKITAKEKDIEALEENIIVAQSTIEAIASRIRGGEESIEALNARMEEALKAIETNKHDSGRIDDGINELEKKRELCRAKSAELEQQQNRMREEIKDENHKREIIFRDYTKSESAKEQITLEQDRLAGRMWEDYELTYTAAAQLGYAEVTAETRPAAAARQNELKGKLKGLGSVNVNAIDEYAEVKERYEFTDAQFRDLCQSRENLTGIIDKLEKEMREKFLEALENINRNFKHIFRELFGGGSAEVLLAAPEQVLQSGIEINVAPPGKIIKSLSLLSGGEQAFVAIALIFAILNVNPTPFCIFDEIEAALDEVNVERYADYMKKYSDKTQFIVITHRRGTMENADVLYGVTMPERGVSKVLSVNVNEVEQKLGVKL